ncbi:MAG: DUF4286 family protein [Tannerellaceae bacterium]|nr:DUF4286 family protein [Tannerellaceae bacterium]
MIVYNITFHIDKTVLEEALTYLKSSYIPRAAASGFLLRPCLRRVMHTPDEERASYAVQFHTKNMDTLEYWIEREGRLMQEELVRRFGNKVVGFTTLLEEIEWEQ